MILQNFYNKIIGFFRQTDIEQQESAKETACNRLRVVLMQDRTNLTPELMERMRKEMVELLSRYVEMDKEALELNLEQDGDQVALMLSIPVIRAKDEEEIKKALEEEDAKKEALKELEEEETEDESEDESEDEESEENEEKSEDEETEESEDDDLEEEIEIVEDESEEETEEEK